MIALGIPGHSPVAGICPGSAALLTLTGGLFQIMVACATIGAHKPAIAANKRCFMVFVFIGSTGFNFAPPIHRHDGLMPLFKWEGCMAVLFPDNFNLVFCGNKCCTPASNH